MAAIQTELTADNAAEYLRMAVAHMARRRIPTTPENYATWFAYVAGDRPGLNEEIDRLSAQRVEFTAAVNARLHQDYVVNHGAEKIDRVRAALHDILDEVGAVLNRAGDDANVYQGKIGGMVANIAARDELDDIRKLLRTLVDETRSMQDKTNSMQANFESKSKEIEELQEELQRERERAVTDPLTGLYNRFALIERLQAAVSNPEESEPPSLIMFDIDHFKAINDTHGHLIGDRVIRFVAQVLQKNIKGKDTAARYGGEEFTVLLPGTPIAGARAVAEVIRKAVGSAQLVRADNKSPLGRITISAGVASYTHGEDVMELINRADQALYQSKNDGRNKVSIAA